MALIGFTFWACSSAGGGEKAPGDSQPIQGSEAGATSSGDEPSPASGSGGAETQPGNASGNTGSVGEAAPDEGEGTPMEGEGEGEAGAGGASNDEPPAPSEAFLRGRELVEKNECVTCHQQNFAGFTVFPNITPDIETGIGSWTDDEVVTAIRDGIAPDGANLCATMQRYSFTDEQAADVVAFLRGLPAVSNRRTSVCPGHGL
jgi:hypothetical protein